MAARGQTEARTLVLVELAQERGDVLEDRAELVPHHVRVFVAQLERRQLRDAMCIFEGEAWHGDAHLSALVVGWLDSLQQRRVLHTRRNRA